MIGDKGYVRREVKAEGIRGWISEKIGLVIIVEINELGVADTFLEPGERIDIVLAPVGGQLIKIRRQHPVGVALELMQVRTDPAYP